MVIPAAGAAILIFLGGITLAVLYYAIASTSLAVIDWGRIRVRASLAGITIIGGPLVWALDRFWETSFAVAVGLERIVQVQLHNLHHNMRVVLNFFLYEFITNTAAIQGALIPMVNELWYNLRPYVLLRIAEINAVLNQTMGRTDTLEHWVSEVGALRIAEINAVLNQTLGRVDTLERWVSAEGAVHLAEITAVLNWELGRTDLLTGFLPLLRTLAQFEETAVGGIERLGGRVAELERAELDLLRDLAKVMPLSVVAALGAVAIKELAETATNPCRCLDLDDFNNLGDRVSALEVAVG